MNATEIVTSLSWLELMLFGVAGVWLLLAILTLTSLAGARGASSLTISMKLFAGGTIVLVTMVAVVILPAGEDRADSAPQAASTFSNGRTCASISAGMKAEEIRTMLGEPGEVQNAEDTRGPGAERWVYGGDRCRVHLLDGVVTYVE